MPEYQGDGVHFRKSLWFAQEGPSKPLILTGVKKNTGGAADMMHGLKRNINTQTRLLFHTAFITQGSSDKGRQVFSELYFPIFSFEIFTAVTVKNVFF
jgi:hypothetical protein